MSTLAHVFDAEGIATVALGLQRNQIANTAPPRGLFCDFPLGRPLGKPGDPEFQHRVLSTAFGLLESTEPVFAEFGESIEDDASDVVACTLPPRDDTDAHPAIAEARGLRPAYDRAVEKFGNRVGAGRTVDVDHITEALEAFIRVAADGAAWKEAGIPGVPARVSQDIRGYYETAMLGLTDHAPAAWSGTRWFLDETEAGKLVLEARAAMRDAEVKGPIWFYMAPGDR